VKRQLRVKTGVRAPAFLSAGLPTEAQVETERLRRLDNMTPLVPLIRCTVDPPCGHCHYCLQFVESTHAGKWQR
jgi:hypothetical protein